MQLMVMLSLWLLIIFAAVKSRLDASRVARARELEAHLQYMEDSRRDAWRVTNPGVVAVIYREFDVYDIDDYGHAVVSDVSYHDRTFIDVFTAIDGIHDASQTWYFSSMRIRMQTVMSTTNVEDAHG